MEAAGRHVGDDAEDRPQEPTDGHHADDPVEQKRPPLVQHGVHVQGRPGSGPEAVRELHFREDDPGQDRERAHTRAEERPEAVQSQDRREPHGEPPVEAHGGRASREHADPDGPADPARGRVLALGELPDGPQAREDSAKEAAHGPMIRATNCVARADRW